MTVGELKAALRLDEAPFWRDLRRIQARVRQMGAKIPVDVDHGQLTRSLGAVDRDVDRTGRRGERVFARLSGSLGVYLRRLGLTAAVSVGASVGVGVLAAALGAAAVAGAGLVTVGAGLAQGLGVLAAVTHGVGKAMKAAAEGDAEKLKEALKGLSPEARRFVTETRPITRQLGDIRREMQDAAFPGFTSAVKLLARTYLPDLRRVGTDTASMFGTLAEQAAKTFSTPAFKADFARVGKANVGILRDLGQAGISFADGLRHVLVMGIPVAEWMAGKAKAGAHQFADAMRSLRDRLPGLVADLGDLVDRGRELAGTGWDKAGAGLDALAAAGGRLVERFNLDQLAADLTAKGRELAQAIIDGLRTGIEEGDFGPLGDTLGRALGESVATKAALVGEGVRRLVGDVKWSEVGAEAAGLAVPFAVGFVNGLGDAIITQVRERPLDTAVFVASLIPIGRLAGVAARVLGKLPIVGPILKSLEGAGKLLEKPAGLLGGKLWSGFKDGLAKQFPNASKAVTGGIEHLRVSAYVKFDDMRKAGGRLVEGLGRGIAGGVGVVVRAGGSVARAALRPFAPAGSWLVARGRQLAGGLGRGIAANVGGPVSAVVALGARVRGAAAGAASWLYNAGRQVISGFVSGISSMIGTVRAKLSELTSMIPRVKGPEAKDRRLLEPAGRAIIQGLAGAIEREAGASLARSLRGVSAQVAGLGGAGGRALVSGQARAARELLGHLGRGGKVFEDLSFRGMSANLGKWNDTLARRFYAAHPGGGRAQLEAFLRQAAADGQARRPAPGGGLDYRRLADAVADEAGG